MKMADSIYLYAVLLYLLGVLTGVNALRITTTLSPATHRALCAPEAP